MWMKLFLPFFPLIKSPIRCFKVRDLQFCGKEKSFFLGHWPIIGIFWLFCKTNNSNRALSTFSYGKPRNFLVLGAQSSNAWKNFSSFLIQVEMVFLGTPYLSAASLFVMPFSMRDRMSLFLQSFRIQLTFDRHFCSDDTTPTTENKKQICFSFTAEIFVLIQIRIYSGIRKWNSNMQMFEIERENGSRDRKCVWYREKFEIEKGYAVFFGEISSDRTYCSTKRDIRDSG